MEEINVLVNFQIDLGQVSPKSFRRVNEMNPQARRRGS
jgi:hypothetical protein